VSLCRPELRAVSTDMLVRRHILPSTSTPVGSRVQPVVALHRGATFNGCDSNLRSNFRGHVDDVAVHRDSDVSARKVCCADTTANCSVIQFSPDRQQCSTPAGRGGRCVHATAASFVVRNDLASDASFVNRSARVSRHSSANHSSDRRWKEKSSGSFLSGRSLGFLQKLSRGPACSDSQDRCGAADASTTTVKRKSSFRDSFRRIFLNRRFC